MSLENLRALEASLWEAADTLRANSNLQATDYSMPGLKGCSLITQRWLKLARTARVSLSRR